MLLDGWLKHKEMESAREQPFQVNIRPHTCVDIEIDTEDLNYEHYNVHRKSSELPLHVFEAQPVVGKRVTTLNIQVVNDSVLDLVITGHTYSFRAALDGFGIHGGYNNDEDGKRQYVRVWKGVDVSQENTRLRFMEMLDAAFKKLCLRVNLDAEPLPDSHMARFINELRENPTLFFTQ